MYIFTLLRQSLQNCLCKY